MKALITICAASNKVTCSAFALATQKRRAVTGHLAEYFGLQRKLLSITLDQVTAYTAKRPADTIITRKVRVVTLKDGTKQTTPEQTKPVSPATINRELQCLKRMFSLAIESGRIATKPKIKMLDEAPPRARFFEREQFVSVMGHLPAELRPVIAFSYITGWRIASEVLPLEWRNVHFEAGEVRLDAGTTKNGEGRVFPFTADLRHVLKTQYAEHEKLEEGRDDCPERILENGRRRARR